ncbi:MAG: response regulator [Chloroflexi bacterium]|nr:response regulator [Chloroflexota bacterium]
MTLSGNEPIDQAVVLIIDDSFENRLLLSSQLGMEGYDILQAGGGIEGIEFAKTHDPDIILLDVMMPDMNGFEVCAHLRQNDATALIPIIMVTALREVQYRIEGIEAGADEFLSRPHVREELLVRVRTLIRLKRARVNLEEERNRLKLLYDISRATSIQLDLETMMADIIAHTQAAVGATKGNIMLLDESGEVNHKFLIRAGAQVEVSDSVTRAVMNEGLGGWLIRHKRGDIIGDINQDSRWVMLPDDQGETGSAIGVPLTGSQRAVGALILNHPEPDYFNQDHLSLLEAIGTAVSAAIENADLFTEISEERRKLEAILGQSTDAVITTDEKWHIAIFNQAAERLLEVRAANVINKSVRDVPQLGMLIPMFENVSVHLAPQEISLNNHKTLYATVSPIQGVGYAAVMQDVTEFKRIEELRLDQERREKEVVKETFSRYMGPRLMDHLLSHEPGLMARRERRRAVVMFADLRNWTGGMIVKVEPGEAIYQLNEFFTHMMEIALDNDGTVFELTGDEILVGFNAPFDQENAVYLALKTAVTMQHKFNALRQRWYERAGTELGLGIGIDQGDVLMGNVGAESRLSFRMVGAAMNRAHRLVDIAEDGQIVISTSVHADLQNNAPKLAERITFNDIGPVQLKGIESPQILYAAEIERPPLKRR